MMLDDSQPLIREMILEVFNGEFCSSGLTSFNILATSALFRGFIILDKPGDSHFFFFLIVDAVLTFSWVGDVIFTGLLIVEGFLVFFVLGVCKDLVATSEDCLGFLAWACFLWSSQLLVGFCSCLFSWVGFFLSALPRTC